MRGGRGRGGALPQATHSIDSLNMEELVGSGVKVDTLKTLLGRKDGKNEDHLDPDSPTKMTGSPLKLISLDQVTMKGEDLTGMLCNMYIILVQDVIFFFVMNQVSYSHSFLLLVVPLHGKCLAGQSQRVQMAHNLHW